MSSFSLSVESTGKASSIEEPSYLKPVEPVRRGFTVNDNIQKIFSFSVSDKVDDVISVCIRLKPQDSQQKNNFLTYNEEENSVTLKKKNLEHTYKFTHIFGPQTTQLEVFDTCAKSCIEQFLNGHNAFIFTYGASNSGKTFTVQGKKNNPGLIPRTLVSLFSSLEDLIDNQCPLCPEFGSDVVELSKSEIDEKHSIKDKLLSLARYMLPPNQNSKIEGFIPFSEFEDLQHEVQRLNVVEQRGVYSIWFSFYEIYNEKVYDLFDEKSDRKPLRLMSDKAGTISIKGLRQIPVSSLAEAFLLYSLGRLNLSISSTGVNDRSSRSHSIFSIKVVGRPASSTSTYFLSSSYSVCDLAGTERAQKTRNEGLRLREAQQINSSFLVLNKCLRIIRENQNLEIKKHVPYRESKLTQILGPSLTCRNTRLVMIVTASQNNIFLEETEGTLKSSSVATSIKAVSPPRTRIQKKMRFSMAISKCKPGRGVDWEALASSKKDVEDPKCQDSATSEPSSNGTTASCISNYDQLKAMYPSGFAPDIYKELEEERKKRLAAEEKIHEMEVIQRKELNDLQQKILSCSGGNVKDIKTLENKLEEQEEELIAERVAVLRLKKTIRLLKEEVENHKKRINELEDKNNNYKEMLDDAKEEVELLQEEVNDLDSIMKTKDEVLALKDDKIGSLELELLERNATINTLEDELQNKHEEFEEFYRNYQALEEKLKNKEIELDELRNVTMQELFCVQKINGKLESENSNYVKELKKVMEENSKYKKDISNLESQLKSIENCNQVDHFWKIGMIIHEKQNPKSLGLKNYSQKGNENILKGKENIQEKSQKETHYTLRQARVPRIIVQGESDNENEESLLHCTPTSKKNTRSRSEERRLSCDSSEDPSFVMSCNTKSRTAIKKKRRPRTKKNLNIPDYADVSSVPSDVTNASETGDSLSGKYRRKLFLRSSSDLSSTMNVSTIDSLMQAQESPGSILKRTLRTGKQY